MAASSPGGGHPSNAHYIQIVQIAAGHALAVVVGGALWGVWSLLSSFQEPLLWAWLVSVALKDTKDWLVASLRTQLATRSLPGLALRALFFPLLVLRDTVHELGSALQTAVREERQVQASVSRTWQRLRPAHGSTGSLANMTETETETAQGEGQPGGHQRPGPPVQRGLSRTLQHQLVVAEDKGGWVGVISGNLLNVWHMGSVLARGAQAAVQTGRGRALKRHGSLGRSRRHAGHRHGHHSHSHSPAPSHAHRAHSRPPHQPPLSHPPHPPTHQVTLDPSRTSHFTSTHEPAPTQARPASPLGPGPLDRHHNTLDNHTLKPVSTSRMGLQHGQQRQQDPLPHGSHGVEGGPGGSGAHASPGPHSPSMPQTPMSMDGAASGGQGGAGAESGVGKEETPDEQPPSSRLFLWLFRVAVVQQIVLFAMGLNRTTLLLWCAGGLAALLTLLLAEDRLDSLTDTIQSRVNAWMAANLAHSPTITPAASVSNIAGTWPSSTTLPAASSAPTPNNPTATSPTSTAGGQPNLVTFSSPRGRVFSATGGLDSARPGAATAPGGRTASAGQLVMAVGRLEETDEDGQQAAEGIPAQSSLGGLTTPGDSCIMDNEYYPVQQQQSQQEDGGGSGGSGGDGQERPAGRASQFAPPGSLPALMLASGGAGSRVTATSSMSVGMTNALWNSSMSMDDAPSQVFSRAPVPMLDPFACPSVQSPFGTLPPGEPLFGPLPQQVLGSSCSLGSACDESGSVSRKGRSVACRTSCAVSVGRSVGTRGGSGSECGSECGGSGSDDDDEEGRGRERGRSLHRGRSAGCSSSSTSSCCVEGEEEEEEERGDGGEGTRDRRRGRQRVGGAVGVRDRRGRARQREPPGTVGGVDGDEAATKVPVQGHTAATPVQGITHPSERKVVEPATHGPGSDQVAASHTASRAPPLPPKPPATANPVDTGVHQAFVHPDIAQALDPTQPGTTNPTQPAQSSSTRVPTQPRPHVLSQGAHAPSHPSHTSHHQHHHGRSHSRHRSTPHHRQRSAWRVARRVAIKLGRRAVHLVLVVLLWAARTVLGVCQRVDRWVRRVLIDNLNEVVSTGLVVGTLLGMLALAAVLVVQIGSEGHDAVVHLEQMVRGRATVAAAAAAHLKQNHLPGLLGAVQDQRRVFAANVEDLQIKALSLVHGVLPQVVSYGDHLAQSVILKYNLTPFVNDLEKVYFSLPLSLNCTKEVYHDYSRGVATAEVRLAAATSRLQAADSAVAAGSSRLRAVLAAWEAAWLAAQQDRDAAAATGAAGAAAAAAAAGTTQTGAEPPTADAHSKDQQGGGEDGGAEEGGSERGSVGQRPDEHVDGDGHTSRERHTSEDVVTPEDENGGGGATGGAGVGDGEAKEVPGGPGRDAGVAAVAAAAGAAATAARLAAEAAEMAALVAWEVAAGRHASGSVPPHTSQPDPATPHSAQADARPDTLYVRLAEARAAAAAAGEGAVTGGSQAGGAAGGAGQRVSAGSAAGGAREEVREDEQEGGDALEGAGLGVLHGVLLGAQDALRAAEEEHVAAAQEAALSREVATLAERKLRACHALNLADTHDPLSRLITRCLQLLDMLVHADMHIIQQELDLIYSEATKLLASVQHKLMHSTLISHLSHPSLISQIAPTLSLPTWVTHVIEAMQRRVTSWLHLQQERTQNTTSLETIPTTNPNPNPNPSLTLDSSSVDDSTTPATDSSRNTVRILNSTTLDSNSTGVGAVAAADGGMSTGGADAGALTLSGVNGVNVTPGAPPPAGLLNLAGAAGSVYQIGQQLGVAEGVAEVVGTLSSLTSSAFGTISGTVAALAGGTTSLALDTGAALYKAVSAVFAFALDFGLFVATLLYLLSSGEEPLQRIIFLLPLDKQHQDMAGKALSHAMRAVFLSSLKLAFFHAGFTWVTLRGSGTHFTTLLTLTSSLLAVLPVLPVWAPVVPPALELALSHGQYAMAVVLLGAQVLVSGYVDDIIQSEGSSMPYLTGFGVAGGMAVWSNPLKGVLLGPMTLALISAAYHLHGQWVEMEAV